MTDTPEELHQPDELAHSDPHAEQGLEEGEEAWVTGAATSVPVTRHVPGIDEVQETTYVDPSAPDRRRRVLLAAGLIVATAAAFVALLFVASARNHGESADGAETGVTRSTSLVTTTSTTPAPGKGGQVSAGGTGAGATGSTGSKTSTTTASTTTTTAPDPAAPAAGPTPPATADPAAPAYVPIPVPAGVSATLGSCTWQPTNGGQLQASGTITGYASHLEGWQLWTHWLQNSHDLASTGTRIYLAPGESKPWSLTTPAPAPPADLACAIEVS